VRGERDRQRVPLRTLLGSAQPKLSQVVAIMEANLEEPLGLEELASLNEVTVRQLERLFHKYLQRTPSQYYLELRLSRARELLLRSDVQVREVALAGALFQELQPVLWLVAAGGAAAGFAALIQGLYWFYRPLRGRARSHRDPTVFESVGSLWERARPRRGRYRVVNPPGRNVRSPDT
jgi:AraC-like DNA-binding protein